MHKTLERMRRIRIPLSDINPHSAAHRFNMTMVLAVASQMHPVNHVAREKIHFLVIATQPEQ